MSIASLVECHRRSGERITTPICEGRGSGSEYRDFLSAFGATVMIVDGVHQGTWVLCTRVVIVDDLRIEQNL